MALISFNRSPYFDDFNPSKNHMKVLFKPGRSLQVRELNNLQSIFQSQIKMFASNIFKNGSRVSGARMNYRLGDYIALTSSATETFDAISVGDYIIGSTSGVRAVVNHKEYAPNGKIVLFFAYTGTGTDKTSTVFTPAEGVEIESRYTDDIVALSQILSIARGYTFTVDDGVFYYDGYFINLNRQTIVSSFSDAHQICRMGLDVVDEIIDSDDDPGLLDNAAGYASYESPGADRYKLSLILTRRSADPSDGSKFILLAKITEAGLSFLKSDVDYAVFGDMLAQRTYEESGNYALNPYSVRILEHKANSASDPMGYKVGGDPDKFVAIVGPNVAYIKGYRSESLLPTTIIAPKGRNTMASSGLQKTRILPAYFMARPAAASTSNPNNLLDPSLPLVEVDLFTGPVVGGAVTGTKIGSAWVTASYHVFGVPASGNAIYKYIVSEVVINPGQSASAVNSMRTLFTNFVAAVDGTFEIFNYAETPSLLDVGAGFPIKTMVDAASGLGGSIDAVVRKNITSSTDGSGIAVFTAPAGTTFSETLNLSVNKRTASIFNDCVITSATVNLAGTELTVQLGAGNTLSPVTASVNLLWENIPVKEKTLTSSTEVFTSLNGVTVFTLPKTDIRSITAINLVLKASPFTSTGVDVSKFILHNGQYDTFYTEGKLTLKSGVTLVVNPADYNLEVQYTYYAHSTAAEGVFTIDSYDGVTFEDVPQYVSRANKATRLSDNIDYRPTILGGVVVSMSPLIVHDIPVTFDAATYLPRVDVVAQHKNGTIKVFTGEPGTDAVAPLVDDDHMVICELKISAFTNKASDIVVKMVDNKRFTMRDIGRIENRIKNMEYYTVLSMLEKSAASMSIKDPAGLDRFKNGFIADDFSQYQAGDISSSEFKAGLDRKYKELRPQFTVRSRMMTLNEAESRDFKVKDGMLMIDYDEVVIDTQPLATKSLSINPYFYATKTGQVILTPNCDVFADVTNAPNINFTIDSGSSALAKVADRVGILNTEWSSWSNTNKTVVTTADSVTTIGERIANPVDVPPVQISAGAVGQTTTITSQNQVRTGLTKSVESRVDTNSWSNISDIGITAYMRPITIRFDATGLAPGTRHYVIFDGVDMTDSARDLATGWEDNLYSNDEGTLRGEVQIPEKKFFTGQKSLVISATPDPVQVSTDSNFSTAEAAFFAGGVDISRQEVNMQVISPQWAQGSVVEKRVINSSVTVRPPTPVVVTPPVITTQRQGTSVTPPALTPVSQTPDSRTGFVSPTGNVQSGGFGGGGSSPNPSFPPPSSSPAQSSSSSGGGGASPQAQADGFKCVDAETAAGMMPAPQPAPRPTGSMPAAEEPPVYRENGNIPAGPGDTRVGSLHGTPPAPTPTVPTPPPAPAPVQAGGGTFGGAGASGSFGSTSARRAVYAANATATIGIRG